MLLGTQIGDITSMINRVRNRTAYNTVHFRIVDEYDFDPSTIAGVVAGACDTNPFHVEIYGVIQQGAWK